MSALWLVTGGLLGALVGSFLNVVVDRGLSGRNVAFPPSACEACGKRLGPLELIPVVSWAAQRGRCAGCRAPLGAQYPLVELAMAGLGVLAFSLAGPTLALPGLFLLLAVLLAAAVWDFRTMTLPDRLVMLAAPVALALLLLATPDRAVPALVGGAVAAGAVGLLDVLGSGVMRLFRPRRFSGAADYPLATLLLPVGAALVSPAPWTLLAAGVGVLVTGVLLHRAPGVAARVARVLAALEGPAVLAGAALIGLAASRGVGVDALLGALAMFGAAVMALAVVWAPALLDGPRRAHLAQADEQEGDPVAVGFGDTKYAFMLGGLLVAVLGERGLWSAAAWLVPASGVLAVTLSAFKIKKLPFGPVLLTGALLALVFGDGVLTLLGF